MKKAEKDILISKNANCRLKNMRAVGLEPTRPPQPPVFKTGVFTNFTTPAYSEEVPPPGFKPGTQPFAREWLYSVELRGPSCYRCPDNLYRCRGFCNASLNWNIAGPDLVILALFFIYLPSVVATEALVTEPFSSPKVRSMPEIISVMCNGRPASL